MKKVVSVLAVVVMSIGMFSCEAESSIEETQALYETLDEMDATGDEQVDDDGRSS